MHMYLSKLLDWTFSPFQEYFQYLCVQKSGRKVKKGCTAAILATDRKTKRKTIKLNLKNHNRPPMDGRMIAVQDWATILVWAGPTRPPTIGSSNLLNKARRIISTIHPSFCTTLIIYTFRCDLNVYRDNNSSCKMEFIFWSPLFHITSTDLSISLGSSLAKSFVISGDPSQILDKHAMNTEI